MVNCFVQSADPALVDLEYLKFSKMDLLPIKSNKTQNFIAGAQIHL